MQFFLTNPAQKAERKNKVIKLNLMSLKKKPQCL